MKGFAILIFIVAFFWLLWPVISRWLKRKAMERTEDYLRQAMGMPPREKKQKGKDRRNKEADDNYSYQSYNQRQRDPYRRRYSGPIIPREYAEDVEYVEYIDYSGTEYIQRISRHIEIYFESQISDAEWTEIKKSRA